MEPPLAADSFIELLDRSGLLSADDLAAARDSIIARVQSNARDAARLLVHDGYLTRFQAERLLEGRYRGFFIDHYKVLEVLGAGGMACLYLAEDARSGQQVAIKVLYDRHKTDAGMLARLKLEALAGKLLHHGGIVRTLDIRLTDDVFGEVYYLVMEFVEGVNLEELINLKGALPWRQAADLVRQAAAALAHAHASGMIHRDVKPGNLLVDRHGSVKILDFGLALMNSAEAEAEEFSLAMIFGHNCLGTADYISPEQSLDSFAVDPRTDIYSLGCTLYVALTAKLPYPVSSTVDKLEGHRTRTAPPLRSIVPETPVALAAVVEKMMAKNPADRYQSMAEVIAALAAFAARQPVDFDFPQVLAWRAKQARRRFAAQRGRATSGSVASSSWALAGLASTSTRRLPQAAADTSVERRTKPPESLVELDAPFEAGAAQGSLSRPELNQSDGGAAGPMLLALDKDAKRFPLEGYRITIGRDPACDIPLSSSQVSGTHCELRREGGAWRVVDLDSKNGVQVNGVAVRDHLLNPGDRLSVAKQHHFLVQYAPTAPLCGGRLLVWILSGVVALALAMTGFYFAQWFRG